MALAGGVTIELPHGAATSTSRARSSRRTATAAPSTTAPQGTIFGSGVGIVVLRRLEDALADGDHIHAVIKGSAVNNDGSSKVGYLAPSVDGQAAASPRRWPSPASAPDTIGYVEMPRHRHGAGRSHRDRRADRRRSGARRRRSASARIGSVKTNIGHLDTAAGVASLIKAALALESPARSRRA